MSRFLVFGRIEAGVVGERDLFAAIVIDALCESLHKLFAALTGRSGDDEDGFAVGGQLGTVALDEGVAVSLLDEVDLVEHDPAGLCGERRIILFKLQHQSLGFLNGIRLLIEGSGVDHVKQNLRAGKMTEEQMTETCAFGSTFDEAGHVGEHEALLGTDTNHAEMRMAS